jgi:aspartokinase
VIGQDKNKSQKPTLIKDLDYDIVDVICARAQMFVTANERVEPKNIRKNDQIMQILNNNQLFYTQKPQDRQITFYENSFKQKDLKKILHEKKKALEEEREKRMQMRDEIFKPVYCRKFHVKRS